MEIWLKIKDFIFNSHRDDYSRKYSVKKKHSCLGSGGNGDVRRAICIETGELVALKCLNKDAMAIKEKRLRFEDEINTMVQAGGKINGIIPIVDYSIKGGWYVMPVAEGLNKYCDSIESIVAGIKQIAETLVEIHDMGLSHRDIKPDNMLYYEDRWVLCDFGLVDIPDNPHNLTKNSNRVGAIKTIAPEMSRNAKDADGKKADVYSLAKSLWMLITKNDESFEGHYDVLDNTMSLHQYKDVREQHLVEIDELLDVSTMNNPDDRPTMIQFVERLSAWQEINANDSKKQISNWNFLKKYLFHGNGPQRSTWEDPSEIKRVLNVLSLLPLYSNLFFPDKGWVDYKKVEIGTEPGCLDIYTAFFIYRVRLGKLYYEGFQQAYWNYFMLEAEPMEVVVGTEADEYYEQVVEDKPGHFVSAVDAMYGVYDYDKGEKFPDGAKLVIRCLKGKYLIVLKHGPYNQITPMDDGRHANCSNDEFRNYVESLQNLFALHGLLEHDVWKKIYHGLVESCPFKPNSVSPELEAKPFKSDPDFVKNNWPKFDFNIVFGHYNDMPVGKAKYRFVFHQSNSIDVLDWVVNHEEYYLCNDGHIRKLNCDSLDIYEATDRETAIRIYSELSDIINTNCLGKVSNFERPYFSVRIIKVTNPDYIFTQEEIRNLMVKADDRVNNTLVIDEEGRAHILTDTSEVPFYPVIHETWCSRNRYVGKYSKLSDLEPSYHYSLGKMKDYLEKGVGQSKDDYDGYYESTEELLECIRAIISK